MVVLSPNISIVSLSVNDLNTPIKIKNWQNGFFKSMTQLYAIYKSNDIGKLKVNA